MEAGHHVRAVDGDTRQCQVPGVPCDSLDLNDVARMEHFIRAHGGRADAMVALEIIEHLHNPWVFMQFCAGMTKLGGHVFLSTPHIESSYSRSQFLRTGQFLMFQDYKRPFDHINPITTAELEAIYDRWDLQIVAKAFPCHMPSLEACGAPWHVREPDHPSLCEGVQKRRYSHVLTQEMWG